MSRNRRPAAAVLLALGLAATAVGASGCSLASPKVIATPYAASDGANADLPGPGGSSVQLRNVLLVSGAKGQPGILVGAVTTNAAEDVRLAFRITSPSVRAPLGQGSVTAKPGQLVQIGPADRPVQIPDIPVPPGSVLTLDVTGPAGGRQLQLPVLAPVGPYATLTPTATPSPTPTASPTATPSPTATASPTTTPTPSAT